MSNRQLHSRDISDGALQHTCCCITGVWRGELTMLRSATRIDRWFHQMEDSCGI